MLPCGSRRRLSLPFAEGLPTSIQRRSRWRRLYALGGRAHCRRPAAGGMPCPRRGDCRCPPTGAKGGKGTVWFPCPLLTPPNPPLRRDSLWSRGETGETGLSSVRRFAFGTLLCPEFSLRKLPRITVRGHPVQGDSVLLRKAPLRSRMCPWSTRRPCGPLAFRRATEGSRVRGKMWGCQEGDKKPGGCLGPLLPPPPGGGKGTRPPRA